LSDFFPEPDSKAVNESGNILDKEKFTEMLKGDYKLSGWNDQSGLLKPEVLSPLD